MIEKRTILLLVAMMAAVLLILPATAAADASADRSMPASVGPGEEFTVTITASNYGMFAQVTETLPAGFSYVSSSLNPAQVSVDGNDVTFTLIGGGSFTYTVAASGTAGDYPFSGTLQDMDLNVIAVTGDTSISVTDTPVDNGASAVRSMPASVGPGEEFTVTITASNYGMFAQVTETLPAGFSYVSSSLNPAQVSVNGNDVTFTLIGEGSFTYTVAASGTAGDYPFSGTLQDMELNVVAVTGDSEIKVADPCPFSATRTLPAEVQMGKEFNVSVTVEDDGQNVSVIETLPAGFSYVSSTLDDPYVIVNGNEITFNLAGVTSFEYTVKASHVEGEHTFSGVIESEDGEDQCPVNGDNTIYVVPIEGMDLKEGWNFFSVPHVLENSSVDYVLADIEYDALLYYNAGTDAWEIPDDLEPLKGYWIKSNEMQIVEEDLLEAGGAAVPPVMNVYTGWNAIGHTSMDQLPAEVALGSIDDSYTTIKGPWNPDTKSYEKTGLNGQFGVIGGNTVGTDIFEMSPFEGYWVYVTQDDVLVSL
ncbi:hypothetical protein Mzhil_0290 [Methanosalsum zhilinae DSM 4017]|uniref:DUF11 domain-containing protein n=1 Tax=Methanosalsum zhilinae (strain DSM 4017 / NBRC 107636 / OCM 62 / WeN5) TaxID=679901 RepID=F7XNX6_METZD|nr:DUF11 domain-containing protein [Methanosalsum zhilinae]AEH60166.1 hypothetical protein Mzhil_0290 [Methanosalsum zhilinae DSM 4017]